MADIDFTRSLIHQADQYCKRAGISRARLATIVVNDGKFFDRIEGGGGFTTKTYQRFIDFFRSNPPPANTPAPKPDKPRKGAPGAAAIGSSKKLVNAA